MQTHDFFTRVIETNCAGPNMATAEKEGGCIELYACNCCGDEYGSYSEAKECCPPDCIYKCSICRTRHDDADDADECCPGVVNGQAMQCPVCLKGAESFEIAADCCLHTHPTMTAYGRQRVAEAVSKGTPWPEAVAVNINH